MIDLGRGFKAPFEDKDWISKTLLGFLWGLLVVTAPAVSGAQVEYIRSVSRGDETLPTWDGFGTKWVEGFLVFVAGFLYFLPVIVLGALFAAPLVVSALVSGGNSDLLGGLFAGGLCFFWIVALIYVAAVSVLFSAAMTNYAMKGSFGAFFAFGEIMDRVRSNTGYITAWFYTLVIGLAASVATSVLSGTGVGAILAPAISYLAAMMTGNVLGQWAAAAYGVVPQAAPAPPAAPAAFAPTPPAPPAPPAPSAPPAAESVSTPEAVETQPVAAPPSPEPAPVPQQPSPTADEVAAAPDAVASEPEQAMPSDAPAELASENEPEPTEPA